MHNPVPRTKHSQVVALPLIIDPLCTSGSRSSGGLAGEGLVAEGERVTSAFGETSARTTCVVVVAVCVAGALGESSSSAGSQGELVGLSSGSDKASWCGTETAS